jgi:glycosyltransferase involved in cell wall biosynthesis
MSRHLNLFDHPVCLNVPVRQARSSWTEHIPFGMWLVSALRPRVVVELGTFLGTSYCAFCQAIAELRLSTRAFAVDTWMGDPHNGPNGPEVLADLRSHHDPLYPGFSTLIESTFDDAASRFENQEIDLLHIDGYHTYDAVAHDFETWRPKVSQRGVVLFHDVAEERADFGVWRLWAELSTAYPSFTFEHEHGLGVLALGQDVQDDVRALVELQGDAANDVRAAFSGLGRRLRLAESLDATTAERDRARQEKAEAIAAFEAERRAKTKAIADREAMRGIVASCQLLEYRLGRLEVQYHQQLTELQHSTPYRVGQRLIDFSVQVAPTGSRRRKLAARSMRLYRAIGREGVPGLARRKAGQAVREMAERSAIRLFEDQPWRPDRRPVFLLVYHNWGGGTERHVSDLMVLLLREGVRPILVRPGRDGRLVWEERTGSGEIQWCRQSTPDRESLQHLLDLVNPAHAHVHHLAGLPEALIELFQTRGIPYDWTIHDYHTICPRIHLIGARGVYCGEPEPASCNACLSRLGDDQGDAVSETITVWRERFRRHLSGARRVFAPSEDAARRVRRYMPGLCLAVRPHFGDGQSCGQLASRLLPGEPVRVVVLGTIVRAKGSDRLLACARDARARRLPLEFHIVGSTDCNAQLARLKNVHVSGYYHDSEVLDRLAAARCNLAFLPAVTPESFMYTLSTLMATGFYTICYDLGAQAERLRGWGWGQALPLDTEPPEVNAALCDAARRVTAEGSAPPAPPPADYPEPLRSYYGFTTKELEEMRLQQSEGPGHRGATPHSSRRTAHARLH